MWHSKLIPNRVENYFTFSANSAVFTLYAGVERYCASRMGVFPNALIIGLWQLSSSQAKKDWYSKMSFFLDSYKRSIESSYLYLHKLQTKSIFQCLGPYLNILSRNLRRGLVFSRTAALICGGKQRGSSLQCIQTSVLPSILAHWFVCQPTDVCIQASKNKSGSACSMRKI